MPTSSPARPGYDVVIAGAGPAGVSCAVSLVRADPSLRGRVLVLDRARFPRTKPCGGGLTGHAAEAMAALGLELAVPSFPSPRGVVRYGAITREVTLERPVRVVRREEFDHSLVAQARDRGVEVREGAALTGYRVEAGGVTVATAAGPVRARVLVGADGAGSLVRKQLVGHRRAGRPEPPPIRLFRAELPARGRASDAMLYDFTLMRDGLRGYLWIFPVPGDRINVGLMHYPTALAASQQKARGRAGTLSGAELTALLTRGLAEHGVTLDGGALRGWPAWGYTPGTRVAAPHVLTVGDAAGIDALTGEGIAVGMEQGLVAGGLIADALAAGDLSLSRYRRALRRATVGRELYLDSWLARLLYSESYPRWLSLVLLDPELLGLYAARVSGTAVLADQKLRLIRALLRHVVNAPARNRQIAEAAAATPMQLPAPTAERRAR